MTPSVSNLIVYQKALACHSKCCYIPAAFTAFQIKLNQKKAIYKSLKMFLLLFLLPFLLCFIISRLKLLNRSLIYQYRIGSLFFFFLKDRLIDSSDLSFCLLFFKVIYNFAKDEMIQSI